MKVLIAGACGFVGGSLARAWRESDPGVSLLGLDNLSRPGSEVNRGALKAAGVDFVHGDVRLPSDLEDLPAVDWVVDAAADPSILAGNEGRGNPRRLVEQNLLGTLNLLEYCRRARAGIILLSTSRVYSIPALAGIPLEEVDDAFRPVAGGELPAGLGPAGVSESFPTTPPLSLYGSGKLASELLVLEYGDAFGIPVFVDRCGTLAGAGQFGRADQGVFSFWINSWLHRRPLAYTGFGGKGRQVRDLLHPRDLFDLLKKQMESEGKAAARVYNVGGGPDRALSLARLSRWCAERLGPHRVSEVRETRRLDVPWLVMDCALARESFGWRPAISLDRILQEIADHAREHPHWLDLSTGG